MKTYALVIQGPIVDSRYNAVSNVMEILARYKKLFRQIVVSTWQGQSAYLDKLPDEIDLIASDDPFAGAKPWPDNRSRQWISSLEGINRIRDEITHILKIRTDQYFDLEAFLAEYEATCNLHPDYLQSNMDGFLHSFALVRGVSFSICDFAMVGPKKAMREFYLAQVQYSNLLFTKSIDIPESDSVRKYLYRALPQLLPGLPKLATLPRLDSTPVAKKRRREVSDPVLVAVWELSLRQIFSVSTRSLMLGLRWRGSMVSPTYLDENFVFREDWVKMRQGLVIDALIQKNPWEKFFAWSRYLTGRERAANGDRGLMTKLLIAAQAGHIRHANGSIFWGEESKHESR